MDELDCWHEDYAICPYCGHKDMDSWEYQEGETVTKCPECGKEFTVEVDLFVMYTTTPKEGWPTYDRRATQAHPQNRVLMR